MAEEVVDTLLMTDKLSPGDTADERCRSSLAPLIERARAGDAAAFEQVMISSQHRVASLAWRMLGNEEDARDATQEVFIRVYKHLKGFKQGQDFFGWLYRITVNVRRDMLRKRENCGRPCASLESEYELKSPDFLIDSKTAEEATLLLQRRAIVARAIATLPGKERMAIVLRDLEGLSTEEVARITGARPSTIRAQISSARTKIKRYCDRLLKKTGRG